MLEIKDKTTVIMGSIFKSILIDIELKEINSINELKEYLVANIEMFNCSHDDENNLPIFIYKINETYCPKCKKII